MQPSEVIKGLNETKTFEHLRKLTVELAILVAAMNIKLEQHIDPIQLINNAGENISSFRSVQYNLSKLNTLDRTSANQVIEALAGNPEVAVELIGAVLLVLDTEASAHWAAISHLRLTWSKIWKNQ
jgi:hypothetical protein